MSVGGETHMYFHIRLITVFVTSSLACMSQTIHVHNFEIKSRYYATLCYPTPTLMHCISYHTIPYVIYA